MSLTWSERIPNPNGWYIETKPDGRFSITFVQGAKHCVLGESVKTGKYSNFQVIGGFATVGAAKIEAERLAGGA